MIRRSTAPSEFRLDTSVGIKTPETRVSKDKEGLEAQGTLVGIVSPGRVQLRRRDVLGGTEADSSHSSPGSNADPDACVCVPPPLGPETG